MDFSVLSVCFVAVPLMYILRKIYTLIKQKRLTKIKAYKIGPKKLSDTELFRQKCYLKNLEYTLPVDLLALQLCMLESKIYNKIDPNSALSIGDLSAAMARLEECKNTIMPSIVIEVIKQDNGTRATVDAMIAAESKRNRKG